MQTCAICRGGLWWSTTSRTSSVPWTSPWKWICPSPCRRRPDSADIRENDPFRTRRPVPAPVMVQVTYLVLVTLWFSSFLRVLCTRPRFGRTGPVVGSCASAHGRPVLGPIGRRRLVLEAGAIESGPWDASRYSRWGIPESSNLHQRSHDESSQNSPRCSFLWILFDKIRELVRRT